jgi:FixJ family two-component response regulator
MGRNVGSPHPLRRKYNGERASSAHLPCCRAIGHAARPNYTPRLGAPSHEEFVMASRSLVSIVDDDESVRESLPDLLREFGFAVQAFSSAEEFLASEWVDATRCLVLDISMPGMSGFDLHRELSLSQRHIPTVFITAHAHETDRVQALGRYAIACLLKPFGSASLLEAINLALRSG